MPSTSIQSKEASPAISGDFRNLRTNGAASLEELKEFLGTLRGKSPQEVIGIVSSSLLIQSVVLATALTFVAMAVFTVGPYLIWGPPKAKPAQSPAAVSPAAVPAPIGTPVATEVDKKKGEGPSEEDAAKAAKAMGLDEAKTADPKANPLDKETDKLLDGLK